MAKDYATWLERCKKKNQERARRDQSALRQMAMAAPAMELLTGDMHWDVFIKIAQAKIDDIQEEIDGRLSVLMDGPYGGADEAIAQRIEISRLMGRVQSLTDIQAIPAILKKQGEEAAVLLHKYGVDVP